MALSINGGYVQYINRHSAYSKSVYGESEYDFFEIRVMNEEPKGLVDALSSDGAWYVDCSSGRLMAFCGIEIDSLLSDNEISFPRLDRIPYGRPQWVR